MVQLWVSLKFHVVHYMSNYAQDRDIDTTSHSGQVQRKQELKLSAHRFARHKQTTQQAI